MSDSCDMVKVDSKEAVRDGLPGSFFIWTHTDGCRYMLCRLPDGCVADLIIGPTRDGRPSWRWDGNEDKPTLTPQVYISGRWQGWFRDGRMIHC